MARGDRAPLGFARVADLLIRRGRMNGTPEALAPTVAAALRADVARAARAHARSRFRITQQRVSLTEWLLPREALRAEEQALQSAERQREQVRRAFLSKLSELPAAGFAEIIATWLNAEGVTSLRAVRRPGSSSREFHFAGTRRRGSEETRLAIVLFRAGRDVDRETVIATRGSLHHYGNATLSWIITTGRVLSGAREEAGAEGAAPCAPFDGLELAQAMERAGIGLRTHRVELCDLDVDLLESLGDNDEQRALREEARPRDNDRRRDRDRDQGRTRQGDGRAARGNAGGSTADLDELAPGDAAELDLRETDIFELRGAGDSHNGHDSGDGSAAGASRADAMGDDADGESESAELDDEAMAAAADADFDEDAEDASEEDSSEEAPAEDSEDSEDSEDTEDDADEDRSEGN
jgi:hypothetical protein